MTNKEINDKLIKDVKNAVNKVAAAYNRIFDIEETDLGTDRVSDFTLILTSKEWGRDAQIKFSVYRPSEYISDPSDPVYYASCRMGMRINFRDGFAGEMHSVDIFKRPKGEKVGDFIEKVFLPTSIEILKFAQANKRKYPSIVNKKLKDFYRDMWKGAVKKVPSEEQISQLFQSAAEKQKEKRDREFARKIDDWFFKNYHKYDTTSAQDRELKAFVDGKSDKVLLKMLKDVGLDNADEQTKDKAFKMLQTNVREFFMEESVSLDSIQEKISVNTFKQFNLDKNMKTYTVKNYKGNLVESLKKFQANHKNIRVLEAKETEDVLKIKCEEKNPVAEATGKNVYVIAYRPEWEFQVVAICDSKAAAEKLLKSVRGEHNQEDYSIEEIPINTKLEEYTLGYSE